MKIIANLLVFLLFQLTFYFTNAQAAPQKFFRSDYVYLNETDSFYKVHAFHRTWQDAKKWCKKEGATLFYPNDKVEADAVIAYLNRTHPTFLWVYIALSSLNAKGVFETINGIPVSDIYNNWAPGEPNDLGGIEDCVILRNDGTLNDVPCHLKYPFVCKKTRASIDWNLLCDMPNPETGKCYKFHLTPMNWTDAYAVCSAEQSYLAVINSQLEDDELVKITEQAPKDNIRGFYLSGAVLLGFHDRDGGGWRTIKGIPLEDSGFSKWGKKQPDRGETDRCGSMFYDGHLNDLSCSTQCLFICEHDVGLLKSAIEER